MSKPLQRDRLANTRGSAFHPFTITPETAQTSTLLLLSKEPDVLCQTLRAITKFCSDDMQNRVIIYELGAIESILRLIDHSELRVRRFALKALAQLCQLPGTSEEVLKNPGIVKIAAQLLVKDEDVFVLEFASLVLAELTQEPLGCQQLASVNILATLFSRMKNSEDPDVQKNCLQTLSNLLEDPVCSPDVTKNLNFSWPSLLSLMHSPFLATQQIALRTVDQLICRYDDQMLQKTFRSSTGVLDLCDILESYEFRDVHTEVLGVIRNYVAEETNIAHFHQAGCILRLLAYLEMALPAMKPHCLSVLTKMSCSPKGRDSLFQTGSDLIFCRQLLTSNEDLLAEAANGVANMTKLMAAAIRMCSNTKVVDTLCVILNDDTAVWYYVRVNAIRALSALCANIPKAAYTLVEPKIFSALRNMNKKYKETPIEAQRLAVQCYINLMNFHKSTRAMLNAEFIGEILNVLQRIDTCLKLMACSVLTGLMSADAGKSLFTIKKGEGVVSKNLEIEHIGLRTALCSLIIASVTDEGADMYLGLGTVHYMVEKRLARYVVSTWEPALEAIFDHHPSAKFAYRGRLEINDYTKEGFYVMKRLESPLPTMRALLTAPAPHCHPALVCAFLPPQRNTSNNQQSVNRMFKTRQPAPQLPVLSDDPNLREYLLKLKLWFGDPARSFHYIQVEDGYYQVRYREKCDEVSSTLKQQAQLLAEFVQEQMSGLSQERNCSMPCVDLHLTDLMMDFKSRVIGLGHIRSGGPLERAVLFKVLADRLGIPCALVRNGSGHACCQVAVPEIQQDYDCKAHTQLPAGFLRANYVVDLMSQYPRLYPIKGYEANKVCGPWSIKPYTAKTEIDNCQCINDDQLETV